MLAIRGQRRGRSQALNVRTDERLGDGERDVQLAAKDAVDDLLLEFRDLAVVQDGRQADDATAAEAITVTASVDPRKLLSDDHVMKRVKLSWLDDATE